jgi:hypothetical protein
MRDDELLAAILKQLERIGDSLDDVSSKLDSIGDGYSLRDVTDSVNVVTGGTTDLWNILTVLEEIRSNTA